MKPGLYLVATPIGNLKDITLRAIETLKASEVIFCENTKHSMKLLNHFKINSPILDKYTDHDFNKKAEIIKEKIESGLVVSLISDAGSPLVSDPGSRLIEFLIEKKCHVETVPGPSSLISSIQLSGFVNNYPYVFVGFLPKKITQKKKIIKEYKKVNIIILTTAPQLNKDIAVLFEINETCKIVILNEITKKFEKRISINLKEYSKLKTIILKGEIVIVAEFDKGSLNNIPPDSQIESDLGKYGSKKIYEIYSTKYMISRNDLYRKILLIKKNI